MSGGDWTATACKSVRLEKGKSHLCALNSNAIDCSLVGGRIKKLSRLKSLSRVVVASGTKLEQSFRAEDLRDQKIGVSETSKRKIRPA